MAFQRPFLISLRRPNPQVPWGFRLIGGTNVQPQHLVQQVVEGSQAEKAGLHEGDEIIQIGRVNIQSLPHHEVQEIIVRCKDRIEIFVIREDLLRGRKENEPPTVKAVVHSNYNSPFQLYSTENVADTLALQTTVLTDPQTKFNHLGPQSPPVVLQSDVLKFVKEEEGRGYLNGDVCPSPPPRKKQAPPPPPKPSVRFQEPLVVTQPAANTEQQTSYETRSQSYQTQKTVRQVYQQSNHQAYNQPQQIEQDSQQFKTQVSFQPQSPGARPQDSQRIPLQSQENRVQGQREEYQQRRYEEQQRVQQQQQEQLRQQELERARQEQITRRQEQIRQQEIANAQEQAKQFHIAQQQERLRQQHIAQQQEQQRQQHYLAQQQEQQRQQQLRQQQLAQQEQLRQQQLAQQQLNQQSAQQREQIFAQEQANRAKGPRHLGATPSVRTKPSFDQFVGANNMKYTSTTRFGPTPESPTAQRHGISPPVWPPKNSSVKDLPKTGFSPGYIQDKCSKKFTWPPPRNEEYDPYNRAPTPTGTVANAWHPTDAPPARSLPFAKSPTPTRRTKDIQWPPAHTQGKESPRHSPRVVRRGTGRFDDYVHQHASISLPPTYRTPPGTQHVEIVYEDE